MNTEQQRQRVEDKMFWIERHRQNAEEAVAGLWKTTGPCVKYAQDVVYGGDIMAVVNVDSFRLFDAVTAVLKAAGEGDSVPSAELIRMISLAFRTHFEED